MLNVVIGLIGLGLVIFLHELGHLLAAKSVGITVEAFSVGWGRQIWARQWRGTEYRVGWLPIGGYCKMQGDQALMKAWQTRAPRIDVERGDFYAAHPLARVWVLIAGPAINLLFAIVVLSIIAIVGFPISTFPNRVVLASDYGFAEGAASQAGVATGDVVTAINGSPIDTYRDLQIAVSQAADRDMLFTVERDGRAIEIPLTPELDSQTGSGRIGVFPWVEPVVAAVNPGSPADIAGLTAGDRIISLGGTPVDHSIMAETVLRDNGARALDVVVERGSSEVTLRVVPAVDDTGAVRLGIAYRTLDIRSPEYGVVGGIAEGVRSTFETLRLTIRGIGLLFSGVDVNAALMGPVRITYLVGEVATEGFRGGVGAGLLSFFNFLSLISITLFFMNLLPIPALDGGQILLSLGELLARRPLHPRLVYHYQMVGNVIIVGLMFFALFNDILFFARG